MELLVYTTHRLLTCLGRFMICILPLPYYLGTPLIVF
jgi:hypothetical protein